MPDDPAQGWVSPVSQMQEGTDPNPVQGWVSPENVICHFFMVLNAACGGVFAMHDIWENADAYENVRTGYELRYVVNDDEPCFVRAIVDRGFQRARLSVYPRAIHMPELEAVDLNGALSWRRMGTGVHSDCYSFYLYGRATNVPEPDIAEESINEFARVFEMFMAQVTERFLRGFRDNEFA